MDMHGCSMIVGNGPIIKQPLSEMVVLIFW